MVRHEERLSGRTVVVTGASSGIGRGAAIRLAALGARVALVARRGDVLDALAAQIAAEGGTAIAVAADVSTAADMQRVVAEAIAAFGGIDIWISNAGVGAVGYFWEIPPADHARTVEVNVTGVLNGAHVALTHFVARGSGTLINIGSVESDVPLALQTTYAATKAAVLSVTRSLNEELRLAGLDDHISVGTVMPWAIDTPFWSHAGNYTGHAARMAALDDPELVVDAIVRACLKPEEKQTVGVKAHGADASARLLPGTTARASAEIMRREAERGTPVPATSGSLHERLPIGTTVDGGVRERMRLEDDARRAQEHHDGD
ncbi:SDR family NAD(P)-dependent oxidoreductase [Microbacterium sp. 1P10UB]|uniref:SDR family NAD(P)-dependent oxidoreductase n=1 Tax=unclassified Microbacterium TaxID=2609290 RepID=UPI0039A134C5